MPLQVRQLIGPSIFQVLAGATDYLLKTIGSAAGPKKVAKQWLTNSAAVTVAIATSGWLPVAHGFSLFLALVNLRFT